jgi:hypothetical protein
MYQNFDSFLNVETWHTCHTNDEERFFKALHKVVNLEDFSPEKLRNYIEEKVNNDSFNQSIDHYVAAAWAVKTYIDINQS